MPQTEPSGGVDLEVAKEASDTVSDELSEMIEVKEEKEVKETQPPEIPIPVESKASKAPNRKQVISWRSLLHHSGGCCHIPRQ